MQFIMWQKTCSPERKRGREKAEGWVATCNPRNLRYRKNFHLGDGKDEIKNGGM